MALSTRCFSDFEDLERGFEQWDRLACALNRPLAAPALARAWWDHMRPPETELRLITVWDGDELVGLVPLVRVGRKYSWVGGQMMPGEPLAKPGLEADVASAIAAALAAARPRPLSIELEVQDDSPAWPSMLCRAWPKPRLLLDRVHRVVPLPRVDLDEGGFDGWMSDRSKSFRRDVRRRRSRLEEAGGSLRLSDLSSLGEDVAELIRLHLERQREESVFGLPGAQETLIDVGKALLPEGRFRLVCVDLDERMVGGLLLFAAGSGPSAFVGGFDDEFRDFSPSMTARIYALEDMAARGERSFCLGAGGQPHKYRLATADGALTRHYLLPVGPRGIGSLALKAIGDRVRSSPSPRVS